MLPIGEARPASSGSQRERQFRSAACITGKRIARETSAHGGVGSALMDALALIKTAQDNEGPLRIVETVVAVNDQRKRATARKVAAALGGNL